MAAMRATSKVRWLRISEALALAAASLVPSAAALSARAAGAITIPSENPQGPDLGKVAQAPSTSSVWRIDPDTGDVSLISGDAVRLTSGPSEPPMITIDCPSACQTAVVTAAFAPAGGGQATIVGFTPGAVRSQGLTLQSVSGAGTTHLIMTFLGSGVSPARATFPLGLTVRLSSGRDAAAPSYDYALSVTMR